MDSNGYPEDDELLKIEQWPYTNCAGLLEYARGLWQYPNYWTVSPSGIYQVATGGWSGNESVIAAMQANRMFWALCWMLSRRGGYFEFEIPPRERRPL